MPVAVPPNLSSWVLPSCCTVCPTPLPQPNGLIWSHSLLALVPMETSWQTRSTFRGLRENRRQLPFFSGAARAQAAAAGGWWPGHKGQAQPSTISAESLGAQQGVGGLYSFHYQQLSILYFLT